MRLVGLITIAALMTFITINSALAGQHDGPPGRGGTMAPPQEAYEACKDKSEGDSVELTTPRGDTLKAVCRKIHDRLAAVPENMPAQ